MKVVLIIPPSPWLISDRDIPMMGPLYLSSYLKFSGHEVALCDLSSLQEKDWYIPVGDLYGVTGVSPQFIYMKRIIEILKDREPDKPVVVGGVHATVCPEHILANTQADACIRGAGEVAMLQVALGHEWKTISGLTTRSLFGGMAPTSRNLDCVLPDRAAIDYYSYLVPRTFGYMADVKREGSIITGRGCPFNCSFCASRTLYGGNVSFSSPEHVVREMLLMRDKYGVEMVNFLDDTFIISHKRVAATCDLLIEKRVGMKWFCLTRVDCVDRDLLLKMKAAGCLSLAIGFESGSDRILQLMNKGITVSQARKCVEVVASTGLMMNGQLMVGFPTESDQDAELTAKFIQENPEVDTFGLHVFQPFPGSDVWNHPEKYGIAIDKNTDFSDYHTIGKPGGPYSANPIIDERTKWLKEILGDRSRERRMAT